MPPEQAGAPAGTEQQQPDAAALQREIDSLKGQVEEQKRTSQFWYDKANTKPAPEKKEEKASEDDTDLLDLITTKGSKGFKEYLKSEGFSSREEVDRLVNTKAAQLAEERSLEADYPELKDRKSEFFQSTAQVYGELVKAGVAPATAMRMAAENVELRELKSGKRKTADQEAADKKQKREQDRLARIAAQGSDRTSRMAEPEEDEEEEMTPVQLKIIRGMLVGQPDEDGKPMNEEQAIAAWKKRNEKGVAVTPRSTTRRK